MLICHCAFSDIAVASLHYLRMQLSIDDMYHPLLSLGCFSYQQLSFRVVTQERENSPHKKFFCLNKRIYSTHKDDSQSPA